MKKERSSVDVSFGPSDVAMAHTITDRLAHAVANNSCICFVASSFSLAAGAPSWSNLMDKFAETLRNDGVEFKTYMTHM